MAVIFPAALILVVGLSACASPQEPQATRFAPVYEGVSRSEEHTSELQSLTNLVCRLLLEKKKKKKIKINQKITLNIFISILLIFDIPNTYTSA